MKINKTKIKLKLEKFFKEELWQYIIVIAFVFLCAWLSDKYIEAIMFCIAHTVIRKHFDKQYHCGSTCICLITTLSIAFFGIMYIMPIGISLLSTIPMCYFISWVGYIAQDRLDKIADNRRMTNEIDDLIKRINETQNINLYNMNEDELRNYAKSKHISELIIDTLVLRVIHNYKWVEIQQERNITKDGIRYHKERLEEKLGIKL